MIKKTLSQFFTKIFLRLDSIYRPLQIEIILDKRSTRALINDYFRKGIIDDHEIKCIMRYVSTRAMFDGFGRNT